MFTSNQKLYISSKTNAARWRAVSMAVTSFTVLPISLSLWEVMINSDILKLAIYMIFAIIILAIRVIVAGKVAYHTTVVELLRTRLDHPPNSPKELKDDQESTKLTGGSKAMEAQVIVFVGVLTALIVVGIAVAARIDTLNHRKLLAEADKEHGHTAHQS